MFRTVVISEWNRVAGGGCYCLRVCGGESVSVYVARTEGCVYGMV